MSDTRPQLDICQRQLKNTKYTTTQRVSVIPLNYDRCYTYKVTRYEAWSSMNKHGYLGSQRDTSQLWPLHIRRDALWSSSLYNHGSPEQRVGAIPLSYDRYTYDVTHYEACISSNYWIIEKALVSEVSNKWHTPVLGVFWDCNWLWFEEGWDTDDLLRWLLITLRAVDWTTCFEILKSAIRPASFSTKPTR